MAQDNVVATAGGVESPPRGSAWPRIATIILWVLIGLAVVLLIVSIVILFVITRVYSVSTPTMEKTVPAGDRVFLSPGSGSGVRRGDVVVLRVPVSVSRNTAVFVKRVIGLPGDHLACCDSRGRVTVNGRPLDESYLYPGDPPSRSTFSVRLGPGQIWVMGDSRTISVDSRQWGPVPLSGVVGRVVLVNHGFSFTALHTPRTYVTEGLAPADTRSDAYLVLALLIVGSIGALLVLALGGATRYMIGQRRSSQSPPLASAPAAPLAPSAPAAPPGGVAAEEDPPTPPEDPEDPEDLADAKPPQLDA